MVKTNQLSRLWPAIAAGIVVAQAIVALTLKPGPVQTNYTIFCYFLLSLVATAAAALNAVRSAGASRTFWSFIACGYGMLWLIEWRWVYFVVLLGRADPFNWFHSTLFFLQSVPLMAAAATYPHWKQSHQNLYRATLNLMLLLLFWVFLYAYFVFPDSFLDLSAYHLRYNAMYFAENMALLAALAVLILRTQPPWKTLYWHLFGAFCLWTFSLQMENIALAFGGYHLGGWFDVPAVAATCWFVWVPLRGMQLAPQLMETAQPDPGRRAFLSYAARLVVLAIPLMGVWELLNEDTSLPVHKFRLLAILLSSALLAVAFFAREKLTNRELVDDISSHLRFSEERFYKAFNSSPVSISIIALPDARYTEVNDAWLRMLGYARAEVIGKTTQELGTWVDPEERQRLGNQLDCEGRVRESQARFRTKSGQVRQVEISAEQIQLPNGPCVLSITRDVTEQKQMEENLRQAQKMEALGRLAGGVAHDFNNLLGVILGYSEILSSEMSADSPLQKRVAAIQKAGRNAVALTGQLLAFSRRQVLQPKVMNLNTMVSETEKMLKRLIGEDVQPIIILESKLGQVKADPGQMVQVIMNLAVNARDAMPTGGKLTIETSNCALKSDVKCQGNAVRAGRYVRLAVGDTGMGMDPETKARIFEPFFTTKGAGKGTGLGLATVSAIVEQSNGYIFVSSEPGKGTTFEIYLPRVDELPDATPLPGMRRDPARGWETLLLVEDDAALLELIYDSLRSDGYKVLIASHGSDALQVAERYQEPIHLLITDVIMPKMSGPELAKLMIAQRPEIKVLFMSGYTDEKLRDFSLQNPEVALLQKPFQLEELGRKVCDLLKPKAKRAHY